MQDGVLSLLGLLWARARAAIAHQSLWGGCSGTSKIPSQKPLLLHNQAISVENCFAARSIYWYRLLGGIIS